METASPDAAPQYADLLGVAAQTVIGLDFDGTLSPIVDDPTAAVIHPEAAEVLVELAGEVSAIAVITGRPARQVLTLGGLEEIGDRIGAIGKELSVFGQYGNERWTSTQRRVITPRPPQGLATFERELPRLLRRLGAGDAYVEDKGLAVAVHTRRLDEPQEVFEQLLPAVTKLAHAHRLTVEPGRNVIEVRSSGMHKGMAVELLAEQHQARGFLFAGDDLGDLDAFEALGRLADRGVETLRVCSASDEESRLAELADLVVPGPAGVLDLLRRFTADAAAARH